MVRNTTTFVRFCENHYLVQVCPQVVSVWCSFLITDSPQLRAGGLECLPEELGAGPFDTQQEMCNKLLSHFALLARKQLFYEEL